MDGFKAYRYYLSVKLHFTTDKYDVFETRGAVKGSREAFEARNDRFMFEKISRKFETEKDYIQYLVANFAYGNKEVIWNTESTENYDLWRKRKQAITQNFVNDLATMLTNLENNGIIHDKLFNFVGDEYPVALNLFIGGKISIETLRIIDDIHPILGAWKRTQAGWIWEDELRRITKLKGFVKYNKSKISEIFAHFKEELNEL
jgi:hypothetical protein